MISKVSPFLKQSPLRRLAPPGEGRTESLDRFQPGLAFEKTSPPGFRQAEAPPRSPWKPSTQAALSLALVGLGVLGGGLHTAVAAPAQAQVKQNAQPTLAVIDRFEGPGSHGNLVDAVLHSKSLKLSHQIGEDVTGIALVESQAEFEEFVTDLMQYVPARALDQVTEQLQKIARDPKSPIQTVNLSLAVNKAGRFQLLEKVLQQDEEARGRMQQFLGLSDQSSPREFTQSMVDKLEKLYDSSPDIQKSRQLYQSTLDQLTQRKIVVVVAAGNEGELQEQLQRQGVKPGPTFFENLFSSPQQTINVGAVDAHHKLWNESNPGADVLALGVGVPITIGKKTSGHDGTSFAAPQVADLIDQMKALNPSLSRSQILDILKATSQPVPGSKAQVGSGEIDQARALEGARNSS